MPVKIDERDNLRHKRHTGNNNYGQIRPVHDSVSPGIHNLLFSSFHSLYCVDNHAPRSTFSSSHLGSIRRTLLLPHFGQARSCGTFGVYLSSYSCSQRKHLNFPVSAIDPSLPLNILQLVSWIMTHRSNYTHFLIFLCSDLSYQN